MKASQTEGRMKATTIRLPDELLERAKIHAVRFKTTFQQLVIEGLEARLAAKRPQRREGEK
jgi:predicted DNA-binding protein